LEWAPLLGRRSAFTLNLPADATHRSDGRGVDVDAGQGDMLRGSNHRTPRCLTDTSKHQLTAACATFARKQPVTYIT
jgi:hypothetical protein